MRTIGVVRNSLRSDNGLGLGPLRLFDGGPMSLVAVAAVLVRTAGSGVDVDSTDSGSGDDAAESGAGVEATIWGIGVPSGVKRGLRGVLGAG